MRRDLVAGQAVRTRLPTMSSETNTTSDDDRLSPSRWREQLLEGDPRRRDRPVAATNSRLPRRASPASVAGQREDRPEADDEREERAVLVLEVAAERARR